MFTHQTTIRIHNVDAAQRLFFADQFVLAHDAWEACLESLGLSLGSVLGERDYVFPIVHAEADYAAPLSVGDRIDITVTCERVGRTSFAVGFALSKGEGAPVGRVTHVHVSVDKGTGRSMPIPPELRDVLEKIRAAA